MSGEKLKEASKEGRSLGDLPLEIIELILSKVPIREYVCFAICSKWKQIRPLMYHTSMDSPLLLYYKTMDSGTRCHYYSPWINKIFIVDCPNCFNLSGFEFLHAKDGWVLVYNRCEMLLVDPLTGAVNKFPGLKEDYGFNGAMFFGSPPNKCTIFIIDATTDDEKEVCITVHDENGWEVGTYYENNKPFCLAAYSNPVFCNNRVYCLGEDGNLGVYDPEERSWVVMDVMSEEYDATLMNSSYLVESNGMLLLVQTEEYDAGIHVLCLDQERMAWEETYDLVNLSLFIGSRMSTASTTHMDPKLCGRAYVPRFLNEPETILAEAHRVQNRLYFRPKSVGYSNQENKQEHQDTSICFHSLLDKKPPKHFGSKLILHSIWYEPCMMCTM